MKKLGRVICVVWIALVIIIAFIVSYFSGNLSTASDGIEYRLYPDGTATVVGYKGTSDVVSIPETYSDHTVTEISGFDGNSVFIKRIEIPATVEDMSGAAFSECTSLLEIVVAEGNPKYSSESGDLFNKEGDTLIRYAAGKEYPTYQVPEGIVTIAKYAFSDSLHLRNVIISDSVEAIEYCAFSNCIKLDSVELGGSVSEIDPASFYRSHFITEFSVDSANSEFCSIDGNLYSKDGTTLVFYAVGKSAESFVIPDTVTTIGKSAFIYEDSLLEIVIPEGVETIGESAFQGCSRLSEIRLPSTVKRIEAHAFAASEIKSVIFSDVVGWSAEYAHSENIIEISAEDLKNLSTAATYLTNDYNYYTWTKE